ncbi:hypothetical protein NKH77_28375 [Streptomyces sp. M19]
MTGELARTLALLHRAAGRCLLHGHRWASRLGTAVLAPVDAVVAELAPERWTRWGDEWHVFVRDTAEAERVRVAVEGALARLGLRPSAAKSGILAARAVAAHDARDVAGPAGEVWRRGLADGDPRALRYALPGPGRTTGCPGASSGRSGTGPRCCPGPSTTSTGPRAHPPGGPPLVNCWGTRGRTRSRSAACSPWRVGTRNWPAPFPGHAGTRGRLRRRGPPGPGRPDGGARRARPRTALRHRPVAPVARRRGRPAAGSADGGYPPVMPSHGRGEGLGRARGRMARGGLADAAHHAAAPDPLGGAGPGEPRPAAAARDVAPQGLGGAARLDRPLGPAPERRRPVLVGGRVAAALLLRRTAPGPGRGGPVLRTEPVTFSAPGRTTVHRVLAGLRGDGITDTVPLNVLVVPDAVATADTRTAPWPSPAARSRRRFRRRRPNGAWPRSSCATRTTATAAGSTRAGPTSPTSSSPRRAPAPRAAPRRAAPRGGGRVRPHGPRPADAAAASAPGVAGLLGRGHLPGRVAVRPPPRVRGAARPFLGAGPLLGAGPQPLGAGPRPPARHRPVRHPPARRCATAARRFTTTARRCAAPTRRFTTAARGLVPRRVVLAAGRGCRTGGRSPASGAAHG